jgi:hypothetical protein
MSRILVCKKCNYTTTTIEEVSPKDLDTCPICGGSREIKYEEENVTTNIELQPKIRAMKEELDRIGNDSLWDTIEFIGDAKKRIVMRQLFFLVAGKVPERELENKNTKEEK